jgi:hypothetical protein
MKNPTTRRRRTAQNSLRQRLRELLRPRHRNTSKQSRRVGSGILRRGDSGIYLPEPSRVSLFPDFESATQFDLDSYSAHIPNDFANEVELTGQSGSSYSSVYQPSLLPSRSLSHFNLNQSYHEHGRQFRPRQLSTVQEMLDEGPSRQASLVSLHNLRPTKSTLRIRNSRQSVRNDHIVLPSTLSRSSKNSTSQLRSKANLKDIRSVASFHDNEPPSTVLSVPISSGQPRKTPSDQVSIASIKHFQSFCVVDAQVDGNPVVATSQDLKYIFDVGDHFYLNNQECKDGAIDIVTAYDPDGNETTHLVLVSPLVATSSGRSRFLLAALVDVTSFMNDAATIPELDTISEESIHDDGVATPVHIYQPPLGMQDAVSKTIDYELSCEDLLGGCYIEDNHRPMGSPWINDRGNIPGMGMYADTDLKRKLSAASLDDVWTELAREESLRGRNSPLTGTASSRSDHSTQHTSPSSDPSSAVSNVDDMVERLMTELQQLYSDFFLLANSPFDDSGYEIYNVSPSVYASKDYVHKHLSGCSRRTRERLVELLGEDTAFDLHVKWGIAGDDKQLYCIPLFGRRDPTWICMLVDVKLEALW